MPGHWKVRRRIRREQSQESLDFGGGGLVRNDGHSCPVLLGRPECGETCSAPCSSSSEVISGDGRWSQFPEELRGGGGRGLIGAVEAGDL